MRRMALVLLGLLLAPLAAQAQPCAPYTPFPWKVDSNIRFQFQLVPAAGTQLGPWYNYWPLEAHFQTPAPPAYPYWPQSGPEMPTAPSQITGIPPGAIPNVMAPVGPGNFHAPQMVPVSWQRNSVPSYWQNR